MLSKDRDQLDEASISLRIQLVKALLGSLSEVAYLTWTWLM